MDLSTTYLGMNLKHPVIASSSPQSKSIEGIRRLADAGAAAITLFSLFEEQIRHEQETLEFLVGRSTYNSSESLSFFPEPSDYNVGPYDYIDLIYQASREIDVPIIGSLNGVSELGWVNTYQGLILPGGGVALGTFLLRQQFLTIPKEIVEAAQMDGTGHLAMLWKVVLPMSRPTISSSRLRLTRMQKLRWRLRRGTFPGSFRRWLQPLQRRYQRGIN